MRADYAKRDLKRLGLKIQLATHNDKMASKKISNLSLIHTIFALEDFAREQENYFASVESTDSKAEIKEVTEDLFFSLAELRDILKKRIRKEPDLLDQYYQLHGDLNHRTY
jgi:poly-D-alanine transfer protein DltD